MTIRFIADPEGVDWQQLAVVYERAPLGRRVPETLRQTFHNSPVRCFAYESSNIIGAGRALTDWINWAVIFDVVLVPEHQGLGHGRTMVKLLAERSRARNVMLYTAPGKEAFYEALGYRRMKTAMALFSDPEGALARGLID